MYTHLVKADELLPIKTAPFLCQGDLQRIHTGFGKIWYERGKQAKQNKIDRYAALQQSHEHYKIAIAINPHDILAVQGIAETVAELEFTFAELFPDEENKYNALPLFKRVSEVEPNGLASNYSTAGYLHKKGLNKELLKQVQHAAKIYPLYGKFKKASFYTTETRDAIEVGLQEAIKNSIMVQSACFSLSKLYEDEKRFSESVEYYSKALEFQKHELSAQEHLQFGSLLLQAGDKKRANYEFIAALKNKAAFRHNLGTIYYRFKKENDLFGFIEFATHPEANTINSSELKIFIAKAQIEQKLFDSAKKTLQQIIVQKPTPKAYFMLANLARKEKNWDAMELSIQKATVLDPNNGKYFNVLADALIYQKKYTPAAEYMEKALANDPENQKYKAKLNKIRSYNN